MIGQKIGTMERMRRALRRMIFGRGGVVRRWWGIDTDIDYEAEIEDAGRSDIVASLVGWKQNVFPEAPLRLQEMDQDGKMQPVMEHDALMILRKPNLLYHGLAMWKAIVWDYNIDGNAFLMLVRNRGGQVKELHYLPAYMMTPAFDPSQTIEDQYWEYRPEGIPEALPAESVVHFRDGVDPEDVRMGCSNLKHLFREMYTDSAAANVVAVLLRNRAIFGPIISPEDSDFEQGDIEETRQYIQDRFTGDNRGQPLTLGGATRIQTLGYSRDDMDVLDHRYIAEERISAALNVPPIVVNFGSGMRRSTYSNVESAREMAWENGMLPMLRDFSETLNERLLPVLADNSRLAFDFDISEVRVLQEDKNRLAQRNRIAVQGGWATVAEARESEGRPWEQTDEVYLRSSNVVAVPVGMEPQMPETEPEEDESKPADLPDSPEDEEGDEDDAGEMARSLPAGRRQLRVNSDAFMGDLIDNFEDTLNDATTKYGQEIDDFFELMAEEFIKEAGDRPTKWIEIAVDTDDQLDFLIREIDEVVKAADIAGMQDEQLRALYERLTDEVLEAATETVNNVIGVSIQIPDPVQRQIIADGGMRVGMVDMSQDTKDAVFKMLHDRRSKGDWPIDIAKELKDYVEAGRFVNAGPEYRARLIAREESVHAQRVSSIRLYDEAGWQIKLVDGQMGDASDADCKARNGKIVTIEGAQQEMDNHNITHPNCTLAFMPYFQDGVLEDE